MQSVHDFLQPNKLILQIIVLGRWNLAGFVAKNEGEYNGGSFVEISRIIATRTHVSLEQNHFKEFRYLPQNKHQRVHHPFRRQKDSNSSSLAPLLAANLLICTGIWNELGPAITLCSGQAPIVSNACAYLHMLFILADLHCPFLLARGYENLSHIHGMTHRK